MTEERLTMQTLIDILHKLDRLSGAVLRKMREFRFVPALRMLLSVFLVVGLLTACNGNDETDNQQAPVQNTESVVEDQSKCWQTEVIDVLYDLLGETALKNYRHLTGGALSLMMVAFAIWMSLQLLKQVSSFKEEKLGKIWTDIARMFFMCFTCGLIASNADLLRFILDGVIFPIYNAFLEFGSRLMVAAIPDSAQGEMTILGTQTTLGVQPTCSAGELGHAVTSDLRFPDGPRAMMDCMVCGLSNSLSFGIKMAAQVMSETNFLGWLVGLLVLLCFLFVKLGFVFYLVDTLFRFTVMVVILPLMIMAYPFKATRKLLSDGIKNMLNSAAFMMFFAIIIVICIQAIAITMKTFEKVFQGDQAFKDFSVPLICILMIGFLVISSIKIAGKLCDSLVGGKSNPQFQKDAKALIMGSIKFVASLGTSMIGMVMPKGVQNVLKKVTDKFVGFAGKAANADDDKGG